MKKFLIPVIVFFIVVIGGIIFAISTNYVKVQFSKDLMFHMMALQDGETLTAEYNNVTTNVVGRNLQRVNSVLGVSAINRVYKKPGFDSDKAVYLTFSHGAEYIVAVDPSESDGVFIFYEYKNKKQVFKVSGYNSITWIKKAVSPSGIYNNNEVLD